MPATTFKSVMPFQSFWGVAVAGQACDIFALEDAAGRYPVTRMRAAKAKIEGRA